MSDTAPFPIAIAPSDRAAILVSASNSAAPMPRLALDRAYIVAMSDLWALYTILMGRRPSPEMESDDLSRDFRMADSIDDSSSIIDHHMSPDRASKTGNTGTVSSSDDDSSGSGSGTTSVSGV